MNKLVYLTIAFQESDSEGLFDRISSSSTLTKVLLVVGVLALAGFIFGIVKSAVKWMFLSAIIGVAAWFFFFQQ